MRNAVGDEIYLGSVDGMNLVEEVDCGSAHDHDSCGEME